MSTKKRLEKVEINISKDTFVSIRSYDLSPCLVTFRLSIGRRLETGKVRSDIVQTIVSARQEGESGIRALYCLPALRRSAGIVLESGRKRSRKNSQETQTIDPLDGCGNQEATLERHHWQNGSM